MRRILVATALSLIASATFAQDCAAPDALLAAGFFDDAKTAYSEILAGTAKEPPAPPTDGELACAAAGLSRTVASLVATKVAIGDAYRTAGNAETAAEQYKGALELAPSSPGAAEGVRLLQAVTAVARARELSRLGQHTRAREELDAALTGEDGVRGGVPDDLAYLYVGPPPSWDKWRLTVMNWGPTVLEVAAAILLLLVLGRLSKSAWRAWRPSLEIESFDKGGFDGEHVGEHFATAIRGQLHRTIAGSKRGGIDLVTGPIQSVEFPAQVETLVPPVGATWLTPLLQAIPGLLQWLMPSHTLKLNGALHAGGDKRGVGVTAQLVDGKQIVHSYTFWQMDFDGENELSEADQDEIIDRLAEFVAIWLLFETFKYYGKPLSMLGTSDWRSYALFRAGVFAERDGRRNAAKSLYVQALQTDPRLRGARFNLARWLQRADDISGAMEQYARVRHESEEAWDGDRDPTFYSATYNMAIITYNNDGARTASARLVELLERIDKTQRRIYMSEQDYSDPPLREYLHKMRPIVSVALGGMIVELGDSKRGLELVEEGVRESDLAPLTQFNIACCYSLAAQQAAGADVARYTRLSLEYLERSFKLYSKRANKAGTDRSLDGIRTLEKQKFDELIEKYSDEPGKPIAAPASEPLAEYRTIGNAYAKELGKNNITNPAELLRKTITVVDRQRLATTLAVGTSVVTAWAHAMDLSRIVGLKPTYVNLLALAGIDSLAQLKGADAAELTARVTALCTATDETDIPDLPTIQQWVNDARTNTLTKVQ